jgi:protocatechuate 3,4-dioxygenase beta subunit
VEGKPVEKALVIVQPMRFVPGDMPLTARSDAAGVFRVPLKAAGAYRVRVEASGWAAATLENVRPGAGLQVSLRRGAAIEGTVRDAATGAPLPGAVVEARDDRYRMMPVWEPGVGHVSTTADAEGRFRLDGLAEGLHSVSARLRGYSRGGRNNVPTGRRVDIVLLPGSSLSGTVRDAQGRPVANAVVRVDGGDRRAGPTGPVVGTDADGRFEVTGLGAGEHRVVARHPSFAPAWVGGVSLEKGADATIDVVLHAGSPVTGRLVAGEERPVPGRVALQETDERPVPYYLDDRLGADAGGDGRFRLTLPPGAHALAVSAPGYASRRVEVDVGTGGSPVDLGDLALESGLVIRGRVRDRAGAPVADAQVFAFPHRGMAMGGGPMSRGQGRTESDGTFLLGGLGAGTHRVSVSASGYAEAVRPVDSAPSPGTPVEFVLDRAGAISGVVADEAGQPIESFRVSARQATEPGPMSGAGARGDTFAAADGRFVLEDVPDGTWVIEASAPDRASGVVSGVVVAGGATADAGRIRLGAGGVVRGLVVDGGGAPVGGASVRLVGAGRSYSFPRDTEAVSDPGGAFELRGVESGTVELVAAHPSYAEGRAAGIEVDPARGPAEARIVMAQGGRIEGRLARRDGSGMPGAIQVQPARVGSPSFMGGLTAQAGPDGTFVVEHVPAGRVIVYAMAGAGGVMESRQSREAEVREGETTTVEFLSREILVTGHVSRSGAPAPGLRLRLMGTGGSRMMMSMGGLMGAVPAPPAGPQRLTGVTDESGAFALIVDEPGTYRVMTNTTDGKITFPMRTVEIPDADTHVVDLAFTGVPLTGVVVDKDTEQPVPAAFVSAATGQAAPGGLMSASGSATAGVDGRFVLELEPGDYRVQAFAEGYAPDTAEVSVAAGGPTQELRLAVSRGGSISGRVVDAAGRAVGGVRVSALMAEGDGGSGGGGGGGESLPDGSFDIRGLPAGTFTLSAQSDLGAFAVRSGVASGQTGVTLTLRPGGSVQLQVYGTDGAPVERAFVRVSRVAGARIQVMAGTSTSPAGSAQLVVPAGDVELEVGKDKLRGRVTVSVAPGGATAAEVTLAEAERTSAP